MPVAEHRTITARVPIELHAEATRLAESRGESMNKLVEHALSRAIQEQRDRELFDSFTLLGQDAAGTDIEFAMAAQYEIAGAEAGA